MEVCALWWGVKMRKKIFTKSLPNAHLLCRKTVFQDRTMVRQNYAPNKFFNLTSEVKLKHISKRS